MSLFNTQIEDVVKDFPLYSQDGKGKNAVCIAVFALGSIRWFVLEGAKENDDILLYGIVVGLFENEYGYFTLNQLSELKLENSDLQIRMQENWKPTPLYKIFDSRLQNFLSTLYG